MTKAIANYIYKFLLWAVFILAIDATLTHFVFLPQGHQPPLLQWHAFIAGLTLAGGLLVLRLSRWRFHYTGFAFMAVMLLKVAAAVVYLWPLLEGRQEPPVFLILHFIVLYFMYLLFEAAFVLRYLNRAMPPT